jgi:CBS domain-containing protein
MLRVGSVMTRGLVTVPPDCPVERARWLIRERKLRHVLVQDHERLVGILSERDLMEHAAPLPRRRSTPNAERGTEVRDCMSVSVETVTADESATAACRRLLERRISCLPVMQDGRLAGVLAEADLLRLYVRVCRFAGHERRLDPPVESRMSREVLSVEPGTKVAEAFELARAKAVRHLPVVHDGWLVGIVSDRDLLPVIGRAEGGLRAVEDVMTKDFVAVVPGTPLSEAAACMLQNGFHALPVLVKGALKGIVTSADVLATLCAADEEVLESAWRSEEALSAGAEES